MIIKIKQIHALSENLQSVRNLGNMKLDSGEKVAEYDCIFQNVPYGHFIYAEKPSLTSIVKKGFSQPNFKINFRGSGEYEVKKEAVQSAEGFEKGVIAFEKELSGGEKCFFGHFDEVYYESGNPVGRLREYNIGKNDKKLFGVISNSKFDIYCAINWKGEDYYLYPLKVQNYCLCIYKENTLISIIVMNEIKTGRHEYIIYALDDIDIDFLCMMGVRFDYMYFKTYEKINSTSIKVPSFDTGANIFANKYDPTFFDKIVNNK